MQNERQPRNSAQVRQEQIEQELENAIAPSSGATVSATHPAFTPIATSSHRHYSPAAAAAAAAMHAADLAQAFKEEGGDTAVHQIVSRCS